MATPQDGPSGANGGHEAMEKARLEHLPLLTLRIRTAMAKAHEARADIGQFYPQAEQYGYHRRALREAIRLADMEPSRLRDYLTSLNKYCATLNVFAQEELLDPMPRPPAPPPVKAPIAQSLGLVEPLAAHRARRAKPDEPQLGA